MLGMAAEECECAKCAAKRQADLDDKAADVRAELAAGAMASVSISAPRDFGWALAMLREGYALRRAGWNGKGLALHLQIPDANSKMTLPYIYIEYPKDAANTPGARCPWLASQTDMLAQDWELAQ
jgi:hypothetical protein